MKTSTWLVLLGATAIAGLAALTRQPELAHAVTTGPVAISHAAAPVPVAAAVYDDGGFHQGEVGLSPSARAGREIWFKATAGNARFHTYAFPQRITALIDWYRVLNSAQRGDRFKTWGLINDPGCCTPGSAGCPARSLDETYGFDWCPGDQELLKFVGKPGYRDPACDFR
ncbi:MAG TPA: cytochrome c, partial [Thiobacillaceae bacterium]|nr:cytochrome c [Thiobacillaceae bacterium]